MKLQYDLMVEHALRGVVYQALKYAQEHGMPSDHYFYITFATHYSGIKIPEYLQEKYPDEMTIILQNQFWDLHVEAEFFKISLSFNKKHETLVIPFNAISAFSDPSVQFGLQFRVVPLASSEENNGISSEKNDKDNIENNSVQKEENQKNSKENSDLLKKNVISLDLFRKK